MVAMIRMARLGLLHKEMLRQGIDVQKFRFSPNRVEFECLFCAGKECHVLALTSRTADPIFFRFDVLDGYLIRAELGQEDYYALAGLLRTTGQSGRKLIPSEFLSELDSSVPNQVRAAAVPPPQEIVRLRADLKERDKPYFDTWGARFPGPAAENKAKTLAVLGPQALAFSEEVNKSSIWSAVPTGREWRPR